MADFPLPGEAGYERLTLRLARRWARSRIFFSPMARRADGPTVTMDAMETRFIPL